MAKDRTLSVVDPEMRCGHKSKRQARAGYKVHLAEEPQSELITEVGVRRANEYDADAAFPIMERQRESVGLTPKELLCDGAYGSADVRAELKELGIRVVAKLRPITDSKHFRKEEFSVDLSANNGGGSVTCPAAVRTTDYRMARDGWYRPVKLFRFPREACDGCELKELCLGGPNGRVGIRCASLQADRSRCTTTRKCCKKRVPTKDGRAEEGAPGEAASSGQGGA